LKRTLVFLILLGASLIGLLSMLLWYLLDYQSGHSSLGGMMSQMMGSTNANEMALAMPGGVWVAVVGLLALVVLGVAGLGYFLMYPELGHATDPATAPPVSPGQGESKQSWAVLLRTSKPEEKRVLEVLATHNGSYLQKFVVREAGLSKLKTHRIIARLAERGILTVEKNGNTNQVSLSPWVRSDAMKPEAPVS
jgi:hypothetical protein